MSKDLKVELIGYDCGWGCKDYGCEEGPEKAGIDNILHKLQFLGIEGKWRGALGIQFLGKHSEIDTKEKALPLVVEGLTRLHTHTKHALEKEYTPIVIGGDHSSAIGTWSGVTSALDAHEELGLIWIDAHMDAHTYESSNEGKWGGWWHGQPITALMGEGKEELNHIGGKKVKISPKHLTLIGIRSYEPAEEAFLKKHNVKVFTMDDIKKEGFETVFKKALQRATNGTKAFGMSIDLDGFDPKEAPAVGTQEKGGLKAKDVLPVIKSIAHHPLFTGLELVEFNPNKDIDNKTALLIGDIIKSIFTPQENTES